MRWADDQTDRLPGLAADVIGRKPDVLVTWGAMAAIAANKATNTVPIAAKHRLPAVYTARGMVDAGGLMAYGPNFRVAWRRAADYVDKILKGAKPADLPIEEPTQYELVVNLRTAKALRLTIPESIRVRADEIVR